MGMKFFATLLTALLFFCATLQAQYDGTPDSTLIRLLKQQYTKLTIDRINVEAELLTRRLPYENYFDSLKKVMIADAEASRDRELMCVTYNVMARAYLAYANKTEFAEEGKRMADACMKLANEAGLDKYKVVSNLRYATYYRHLLQNQKALDYNNQAIALASTIGNDSLLASAYSNIADTWANLNNTLARFQALLNSRDFAEKSHSHSFILNAYASLANFYESLEEYEKAKDFYTLCINKGREWNGWSFVIGGIRGMGLTFANEKKDTLALMYYRKALALIDSVHMDFSKVNVYFDILNYYLNSKDADKSLAYIKSEPAIMDFINKYGIQDQLDKLNAYLFYTKKQYDSALAVLQKGAPGFYAKEGLVQKFSYTTIWAQVYEATGNAAGMKEKLLLAKKYADSAADLNLQKSINDALYQMYDSLGDAKQAFVHYKQMIMFKDSIESLGKQKDLLSAEIGNENKREAREKLEEEEHTRVRNNLQYMGITAAIATLFIMLVIFGVFKMSAAVIKGIGFFAFIFLFEFIILLLDNQIHHLTEGEPWKVLGIKIIIIAILLPLHHKLEERVTHYLTNKAHRLRDGLHFKASKVKDEFKKREN